MSLLIFWRFVPLFRQISTEKSRYYITCFACTVQIVIPNHRGVARARKKLKMCMAIIHQSEQCLAIMRIWHLMFLKLTAIFDGLSALIFSHICLDSKAQNKVQYCDIYILVKVRSPSQQIFQRMQITQIRQHRWRELICTCNSESKFTVLPTKGKTHLT